MRSRILAFLALVPLLCVASAGSTLAANYPSQPIRFILPAAAGGVLDVIMRRLSDKLGRSLGQTIIVDNKPGANGLIGMEAAARAKPDGYTVLFAPSNALCVNPALFAKLPYDPVRDFAPVTRGTRGNPILLVGTRLPAKTLAEFVEYAKAHPRLVTYGTPAIGSPQHIAAKLLEQLTGIEMVHVPYKNQPQAMTDLIGGQIDAAIEFASVAGPHVAAGKVRALVVLGPRRKPIMPDVPSAAESGLPAFDLAPWNGFLVPAGTPPEIVARLNKELVAALNAPDFGEWMSSLGAEVVPGTPDDFAAFIKTEMARWSKIVRDANIKLE